MGEILWLQTWAEKVYPTDEIKVVVLPSHEWPADVLPEMGEDLLKRWAAFERNPRGLDFIYGLFPEGELYRYGLWGTAFNNDYDSAHQLWVGQVAIGEALADSRQRKQLFAHEIAHLPGRSHPNVGTGGSCSNPSPGKSSDWPQAESDGIQVWGLEPGALAPKHNPDPTVDYMSYCWMWFGDQYADQLPGKPAWTSPWTYNKLFEQWFKNTKSLATDAAATDQASFVVSGIVNADGAATLYPVWESSATTTNVNPPSGTSYCIAAKNGSGNLLSSYCFDLGFFDHHQGVSKSQDSFYLVLPNPGNAARIALTKNGIELATRQVSAHRPTVTVVTPNGGEFWPATGTRIIRWSAADLDGDALTYNVFYSRNGTDWMPVAMGIQDTQVNVDLAELGGGSTAKVKVEVTDGVNTASDASDGTLSVAPKAPWVVILSPQHGTVIPAGNAILLQGDALSLEDGALADAAYRWSSNRDGNLGTGADVVAVLSPGEHAITLTATGGSGLLATDTVKVFVGAKTYLPVTRK